MTFIVYRGWVNNEKKKIVSLLQCLSQMSRGGLHLPGDMEPKQTARGPPLRRPPPLHLPPQSRRPSAADSHDKALVIFRRQPTPKTTPQHTVYTTSPSSTTCRPECVCACVCACVGVSMCRRACKPPTPWKQWQCGLYEKPVLD